eukprot:SAG11_NODE_592_length_8310_cov_3.191868_5_plen_158_part_00
MTKVFTAACNLDAESGGGQDALAAAGAASDICADGPEPSAADAAVVKAIGQLLEALAGGDSPASHPSWLRTTLAAPSSTAAPPPPVPSSVLPTRLKSSSTAQREPPRKENALPSEAELAAEPEPECKVESDSSRWWASASFAVAAAVAVGIFVARRA